MSAPPNPVYLLPHVPKCAGSTVEIHLRDHLEDGFWSPGKRSRHLPINFLRRKFDATPPAAPEEIVAVSGHWVGRSVERLFPGRQLWRGVLLREPAALVLSWYNYRMMRYSATGRSPYPFALHLRSLPPDPVAHFLLERWLELPWWRLAKLSPGEKCRMLDEMLDRFDFVGDISDCDRLIALLSKRLDIPPVAASINTADSWRALASWEPLRRDRLSPEDAAELRRRTRLDDYLWRRWALRETAIPPAADQVAPFLRSELARPLAEIRRRQKRGLVQRAR